MSSLSHAIERHPAGSALPRTSPSRPALRLVPAPQPLVRLTRRGRLAVFVGALLLVAVAFLTFGPSVVATDAPGSSVPTRTVTVQPGQTLWDIAARSNPDGDIRATVQEIMTLNSLPSAGYLQIGDRLAVPAG
ncbi:MAG: LysM domain-containing protein [Nocardioidaceae bacterium]